MDKAKPFDIPKREVWEAYKRVRANQGAAGVDGQSIADFEADLSNNLYKLWNWLASRSYFPPPVRRVDIPKDDGRTRPLGIPTVADRIAQMVVKRALEPLVEPHFHDDSYGYPPGKSALDAVGVARRRCWRYDWVLDLDIKSFFDVADDAICHCRSEDQARALRASLERRFADCGLTLHPEKTKIVYCKDEDRRGGYPHQTFDFLGYTFRPRLSRRWRGTFGVLFSPAASDTALKTIPKLGPSRAQRQVAERPGPDVQQPHPGLEQLLRPVLQIGSLPDPATHRPYSGSMGASEVQVSATPSATNRPLDHSRCAATTVAVRPLGAFAGARPDNGSRMRRESHVRFCERAAVRFHRATHLVMGFESMDDARRIMVDLKARLAKFGLSLHEDKTRLIAMAGSRPWPDSSVTSGVRKPSPS